MSNLQTALPPDQPASADIRPKTRPVRWALILAGILAISCSAISLLLEPDARTLLQPTETSFQPADTATSPAIIVPTTPTPPELSLRDFSGIWSACIATQTGTGETTTAACDQPRGMFVTLYLEADCAIGQVCGSYVKGAFESEFMLLRLELTGSQGRKFLFFAETTDEMFEGASTEVELKRAGPDLIVIERGGGRYRLAPGCDPVIEQGVTFGCIEEVR